MTDLRATTIGNPQIMAIGSLKMVMTGKSFHQSTHTIPSGHSHENEDPHYGPSDASEYPDDPDEAHQEIHDKDLRLAHHGGYFDYNQYWGEWAKIAWR